MPPPLALRQTIKKKVQQKRKPNNFQLLTCIDQFAKSLEHYCQGLSISLSRFRQTIQSLKNQSNHQNQAQKKAVSYKKSKVLMPPQDQFSIQYSPDLSYEPFQKHQNQEKEQNIPSINLDDIEVNCEFKTPYELEFQEHQLLQNKKDKNNQYNINIISHRKPNQLSGCKQNLVTKSIPLNHPVLNSPKNKSLQKEKCKGRFDSLLSRLKKGEQTFKQQQQQASYGLKGQKGANINANHLRKLIQKQSSDIQIDLDEQDLTNKSSNVSSFIKNK